MQAIKLHDIELNEIETLLNEQLILSVAKGVKVKYKRCGKEVVINMMQAQNRLREARRLASWFSEDTTDYATYTAVGNEYALILKELRAKTINNEEWRELALNHVGDTSNMLNIVLNISFETDDIDTSVN